MTDKIPSDDMNKLRERIQKIQESGLATPAQKLFDLAMAKPPQQLMQEFFVKSSPTITQAMQDAVISLLGQLPPREFEMQVSTTGDRLAALMLQLLHHKVQSLRILEREEGLDDERRRA